MNIQNLYKDQRILKFKECYALEKIHGTSANIHYIHGEDRLTFFPGGCKMEEYMKNFNEEKLLSKCREKFNCNVKIFGEAYGGKCQRMSETYGKTLKFVVFDVKIGETWLAVPNAQDVANSLDLDFVHWEMIPSDIQYIDEQRDLPSVQARKNGIEEPKPREGVVLRPLEEYTDNRGNRVICKHKGDAFKETKTKREVSPEKLKVLEQANSIADEWVTPMRLEHILSKMPDYGIEHTGGIIRIMIEDIYREGKGEIIESQDAQKAIGKATAKIFKQYLNAKIKNEDI